MKSSSMMLLAAAFLSSIGAVGAEDRRNPFDVPDLDVVVVDDEVRAFAAEIEFDAIDSDVNAHPWPEHVSTDNPMHFAGIWAGRWNNRGSDAWNNGSAKVVRRGPRLFIHFYEGGDASGGYLIEAVRQADGIYIGRYYILGNRSLGVGRWVGRVVSTARIDGYWTSNGGRWDLRRRFE